MSDALEIISLVEINNVDPVDPGTSGQSYTRGRHIATCFDADPAQDNDMTILKALIAHSHEHRISTVRCQH